ncbi:hypothetical protein [Stappia indica]|uniref:hypothetical protein n=1 Tax=Stappia indica TaxID=538381 RepID=UPI00114638DF|nr:hypothetical protein [Stappia indica]
MILTPPYNSNVLRRYTNLSSLIYLLSKRKITFLDPEGWDDKNDTHFLSVYKKRLGAKSVLAICFTQSVETYHHWKVFSGSPDGVCINFNKSELLKRFSGDGRIIQGVVKYEYIRDLKKRKFITNEELPFLKRWPYRPEKEYRIVFVDVDEENKSFDFDIDLSSIKSITLSPWIPESIRHSIRSNLKKIRGCEKVKIFKSTLIQNGEWQQCAEEIG